MKKIHYINIGNPKSGTSAVFNVLCQHPEVDYCKAKENYGYSQYYWTLEQYIDYYKNFNVSLNFCPTQCAMESKQIRELESVFTHASMIFRNPVDFIESHLNFLSQLNLLQIDKHNDYESFVNMLLETNWLEYTKIVKRWTGLSRRPFLIFKVMDSKTMFSPNFSPIFLSSNIKKSILLEILERQYKVLE